MFIAMNLLMKSSEKIWRERESHLEEVPGINPLLLKGVRRPYLLCIAYHLGVKRCLLCRNDYFRE